MSTLTRIKPRVCLGFLILALYLLRVNTAIAQIQPGKGCIYVTQFGVEQGLSQSMVSRIIQDKRGLIWMTTGDGLNCFNGEDFRVFKAPVSDSPVRSDQTMREILIDNQDRILVSTSSSIYSFHSETGLFKLVSQKAGQYPFLVQATSRKNILCWWPETGYHIIKNDQQIPVKINYFQGISPPEKTLPNDAVLLSDGTILISSENGLMELIPSGPEHTATFSGRWYSLAEGCQSLTKNSSGEVFCLSGSKILRFMPGKGIIPFKNIKPAGGFNLFADSKGNLWISDRTHRKLYRSDKDKTEEVVCLVSGGKLNDTIVPSIRSIYEDKEGNIWFGTDGDGVLLYSPDLAKFSYAGIGFTRCIAKSGAYVYAGTYHNGLWKLKEDLSEYRRLNPGVFGEELYFLDLTTDFAGRLWIATPDRLFVAETTGQVIFSKPIKTNNAKFIRLKRGWISLSTDSHILNFKEEKQPELIGQQNYPFMRSFFSYQGWNWIGSPYGVYRVPDIPEWTTLGVYNQRDELDTKPVFSMLQTDTLIWVSNEYGLDIYNKKGKKLPLPESLLDRGNEIVYSLGYDRFRRIWFAGNKGIGCISGDLSRVVMFGRGNNLQSLEFNHNAFCQGDNGILYFGGINGLNGIDPSLYKPVKKIPTASLFSLVVSDVEYSQGIPPGYLELELDRNRAHISGKVFSTNYIPAGLQEYSFYLKGYQHEWSKPTGSSLFTYRNLPPGEYQLWVKCWDSNKNEGKPVCLLKILIKPPFWKTWWFLIALTLMIITVTVLIVRKIQEIRYGNKLRELEYQNAINKERLRIAKDMHDEIGASLTRISIISELVKKQVQEPPKAVQLIHQINEIAGNVVDEMGEIIWAINPKNDNLQSFAAYFRQYASNYLESAEINGKFKVNDELPAVKMTAELRRNIFLTCKEALHNLVKHSSASQVYVSLDFRDGELKVDIQDDGKGFDVQSVTGRGNGLINMQKRIDESGGTYQIKSSPGKGTLIQFSIRLS